MKRHAWRRVAQPTASCWTRLSSTNPQVRPARKYAGLFIPAPVFRLLPWTRYCLISRLFN